MKPLVMLLAHTVTARTRCFSNLNTLFARPSFYPFGDGVARLAASSGEEYVTARMTRTDLSLNTPRECLFDLLVLSSETLPKLDNGIVFQVVG